MITILLSERLNDRVLIDILSNPPSRTKGSFEYYLNKGRAWLAMSYFENAIVDLTRAIELDADSHEALQCRGLAYAQTNRDEKALIDFDRAIGIQDSDWLGYFLRGNLLAGMCQYESSISDLYRAVDLNSSESDTHFYLAKALQECNFFRQSIECLNNAIELAEKSHYLSARGTAKLQLKDYRTAVVDYSNALAIDENNYEARFGRATCYSNCDAWDAAIEEFSICTNMQPDHARAHFLLGCAYMAQRMLAEALTSFMIAGELEPHYQKFVNLLKDEMNPQIRDYPLPMPPIMMQSQIFC
jgi:tetratricopeptide (TPR) repeat protein